MRFKIYLILFVLFAFSCSSDSSSDNGTNNNGGNNNLGNTLLVSEIITSDVESSDYVYSDRYFYDGNKLTSITNEYTYQNGVPQQNGILNFIYTNNKISRIDEYYENNNTGISGRYTFEYDNQGRVSFYDYCDFGNSGDCNYYDINNLSYSSNGTVTNAYVYDVGGNDQDAGTLTIQLDNSGNILSVIDSYQDVDANNNSVSVTVNASFEYDNQNSPFKNIIGMDAIILLELNNNSLGSSLSFNAFNNCTSFIIEYSDEDEIYQYNYSYDYNEDGYPRQVILMQNNYSSTININYY
tara:strand:- start:502 stop:1389 length:888 start_codon:yes stop_codon:yes gene_type:complete